MTRHRKNNQRALWDNDKFWTLIDIGQKLHCRKVIAENFSEMCISSKLYIIKDNSLIGWFNTWHSWGPKMYKNDNCNMVIRSAVNPYPDLLATTYRKLFYWITVCTAVCTQFKIWVCCLFRASKRFGKSVMSTGW